MDSLVGFMDSPLDLDSQAHRRFDNPSHQGLAQPLHQGCGDQTEQESRFPLLGVPNRPTGIAGVYDAADDWSPIYDRTDLAGFYVAMGTSGNQFKNAPLAGRFLATLVDRVEAGHDHDRDPLRFTGEHTGVVVDLGAFSRRRPLAEGAASRTVMG